MPIHLEPTNVPQWSAKENYLRGNPETKYDKIVLLTRAAALVVKNKITMLWSDLID